MRTLPELKDVRKIVSAAVQGLHQSRGRKRKAVQQKLGRKAGRREVLCLLIFILLAAAAYMTERSDVALKEGQYLERAPYGGTSREVEVLVDGISEEEERLLVTVSPQAYTETAAEEAFAALMEELPNMICGENESLDAVRTDLSLPSALPAYGGIHLSWYPEDPELISYEGQVENLALKDETETALTLVLAAGEIRREYSIPVRVLPPAPDSQAVRKAELEAQIQAADSEGIQEARLRLPDTLHGQALQYHLETSKLPVLILFLGILAAGLLHLQPEEEKRKARKLREQALLADYPELVSKLMVYIGAGLTLRNAWNRITELYEEAKASGQASPRCTYEEMLRTRNELQQGRSEGSAYLDFAHRCGLRCYVRLGALLEQNRKNGDGALRGLLQLEMQEAFEQRKNMARRLGEEAGTKLMGPLFLSLLAILMIVVMPAMLSLQ